MKSQKGLTLIELLISITLLGLLLGVFTSVYTNGVKVYQREFKQANLQNENRIVLDRIISDIKQAYSVDQTSTATSLILLLPAIDEDGDILYEGDDQFKTDQFIYLKSGQSLVKIIAPDIDSTREAVDKTILDKVSSLTFTYLPDLETAEQIEVTLQTQDTAGKNTITINNTSKATLRNK